MFKRLFAGPRPVSLNIENAHIWGSNCKKGSVPIVY